MTRIENKIKRENRLEAACFRAHLLQPGTVNSIQVELAVLAVSHLTTGWRIRYLLTCLGYGRASQKGKAKAQAHKRMLYRYDLEKRFPFNHQPALFRSDCQSGTPPRPF